MLEIEKIILLGPINCFIMFRRIISSIKMCGVNCQFLDCPQQDTTTTNIKLPCLSDGRVECAEYTRHSIQSCCLHYSEARVCVVTSVIYQKMEDLQRQCTCTKVYVKLGKTDGQNAIKSDYTLITNLMHWLLFIHKILFSSTCFEHQVLIFRRT